MEPEVLGELDESVRQTELVNDMFHAFQQNLSGSALPKLGPIGSSHLKASWESIRGQVSLEASDAFECLAS